MTSPEITRLRFGVEMEMLLRPKTLGSHPPPSLVDFWSLLRAEGWSDAGVSNPDRKDNEDLPAGNACRLALRRTLAALLGDAGVPAQADERGTDEAGGHRHYGAWTLADENLNEPHGFWRIEVISRVLETSEDWGSEMNALFHVLTTYCDIRLTRGCSMHVHVSVAGPGTETCEYSDEQLRRVAKATYLFTAPLAAVVPEDRKDNQWARLNAEEGTHSSPRRKALNEAYRDAAARVRPWTELFGLLDQMTRDNAELWMQTDRFVAWNFANVALEKGTIEFRLPPGVDTPGEACHWAAFTLGFIAEALALDLEYAAEWSDLSAGKLVSGPDIDQLRAFITRGLGRLSASCRGWLIDDHLVVENHWEGPLTAAEWDEIDGP